MGSFHQDFALRDEADRRDFEQAENIFDWLATSKREGERATLLRRLVFPALLSDFLHFIYEALETSRKAKLNVTFALLRKPIQENLFVLESIAANVDEFAAHLVGGSKYLRSQRAGGVDAHKRRIADVLRSLKEEDRFDAAFLAQLRYDKSAVDGFDGLCNLALHLFTDHPAIQTEPLNINFVFSGHDEKLSQWYFLYSRLPYLLFYARRLVEHLYASFEQTNPIYIEDIERRAAAGSILWSNTLPDDYWNPAIEHFVEGTTSRLGVECARHGWRAPSTGDLIRMHRSGAWPGESWLHVRHRQTRYAITTRVHRTMHRLTRRLKHSVNR